MSKCFPIQSFQQIFASLPRESFARAKGTNLSRMPYIERVRLALTIRKQLFINSSVDTEGDVNQGVPMKPSMIHSPKFSNSAPQGVFSRPSAEASALQSPSVTLNTNTSPLRETSLVPESKKMDVSATPEQAESSSTILTEPDLTTAGGAPLVDVEMVDRSQPDEAST